MHRLFKNSTSTSISACHTSCSTAEVNSNLKKARSLTDFFRKNTTNLIDQPLSEYLMKLLQRKTLNRSKVAKASGLDKAYVYQIFDGKKSPSRDKLIAIAFGMQLDEEETRYMLKLAGYSELYPKIPRDAIILYGIQRGLTIQETDDLLAEYNLPTLFSPN